MPSRRRAALVATVGVLLGLVGNIAAGTVHVRAQWVPTVWVTTALLAVLAIGWAVVEFKEPDVAELTSDVLDDVTTRLAQTVEVRWRQEEDAWRLHDPFPIQVRWHIADNELFDHWANIRCAAPGTKVGPLALTGRLAQVCDTYRLVPSGRLVFLGRAGAGKTVIAARLVRGLLKDRAQDDPIPVLFDIASWNPEISLRDWLIAELARAYPIQGILNARRKELAQALVDAGRVLPVLDGFDEIDWQFHATAITRLNNVSFPFVLTSRPNEYASAVRVEDVLTGAAVVVLEDLTLADLADYLPRSTRPSDERGRTTTSWDPVLAFLREHPASSAAQALQQVLSTPFMVALARTGYSDGPSRNPSELLNSSLFPTANALEGRLLDVFVNTVYAHPRNRRWTASRARRWLEFLATRVAYYRFLRVHDFIWWDFFVLVPGVFRLAVWLLALGLTMTCATWLAGGLRNPIAAGLVVGLASWLMAWIAASSAITSMGSLLRSIAEDHDGDPHLVAAPIGFVILLSAGLATWRIFGFKAGLIAIFAFVLATVIAEILLAWPMKPPNRVKGEFSWRLLSSRFLYRFLTGWAGVSFPKAGINPSSSLQSGRTQALLRMLAAGFLFGVVGSVAGGIRLGLAGGLAGALIVGLAPTAWIHWVLFSRLYHPIKGNLPWAICSFLEDAYRSRILGKFGGEFHFRHNRFYTYFGGR